MPDIFTQPNNSIPAVDTTTTAPAHVHHFASFCDHPYGISFDNQEADETVLLFLRKHFITNIPWILIVIFLLLLPAIFSFLLPIIDVPPFFILPDNFLTVFFAFYYLIIFTYAFIQFITWYFNISLVTQKRVVDIDFSDIVYHDVAVTKLNLIEDTNYTQTGFIASLFDFGDVFVQTAGEKLHFDFLSVPHPSQVVDIIQNLIGRKKDA